MTSNSTQNLRRTPKFVLHTSYRTDRALGLRRVAVVEKWLPQTPNLGVGGFGVVRLEKLDNSMTKAASEHKHRAVKRLYKPQIQSRNIDYKKELLALMKFSRPKVEYRYNM
jgi:hypothetical protein